MGKTKNTPQIHTYKIVSTDSKQDRGGLGSNVAIDGHPTSCFLKWMTGLYQKWNNPATKR